MEIKQESVSMRRSLVILMRCCFSAMEGTQTRLELVIQVIMGESLEWS